MPFNTDKIIHGNRMRFAGKVLLSLLLLVVILHSIFIDGLRPYQSYKDYDYQNNFSIEACTIPSDKTVSQVFTAKGNVLNNLSIYLTEGTDQEINIAISDTEGNIIEETEFHTAEYTKNAWNKIGLSSDRLKRDQTYIISFSADEVLDLLILNWGDTPIIFDRCFDSSGELNASLAIGLQFTYTYFTLGNIFEILLKVLFSILLWLALCYTIFQIEDLWAIFQSTEKKVGLSYAVFFAAITTMLFNPLDPIRNEMTKFSRIIGIGVISDVDISKRISNFNYWYILFGLTFIGFYLLCNAVHQKKKSEDAEKAQKFLDNFIVLANCSLIIRCITYFQEESGTETVFHFSEYVILLVITVVAMYILLNIDRYVSLERFGKLCLMGASLSYPLMVMVALEWDEGRVLLGMLSICAGGILLLTKLGGKRISRSSSFDAFLYAGVFVLPFAPLVTSIYIEIIHVLNQWGIFVAHPARYYKVAALFGLIAWGVAIVVCRKKRITLPRWKTVAFPVFIFGIACLANQIPISITSYPDLFEGANAGILISDFLNFGAIPNVEHYGGHMMTGVWEGILYGILNRDFDAAFVSPYSSLLAPFLCVLFYYLIKHMWNENMALFAALLFPFYSAWSSYGLGMLVCLAVMAYIKKHTYPRAFLVWGAFIWSAFYRLDLGFAFGVALIISIAVYCFAMKDKLAVRQLLFALLGWGVTGVAIWFILCVAKGVNPISRLLEFLMVNLSNQNWAYSEIGNTTITLFGWAYIIIPFLVIIALIYITFSKELRGRISPEKWVLLQMFGWSYFGNFSRGLVRHSLAETATSVVIWCGYLFLAMTVSCYKKNKKLFFPSFLFMILCNNLFLTDSNFVESPILDNAVVRPASIVESWQLGRFDEEDYAQRKWDQDRLIHTGVTVADEEKLSDGPLTYWEQLSEDKEIVQRINLSDELLQYADKYAIIDKLLDEGETFGDFINKTLLYCILGRECPVYISQSPLQLSGEFMQEEFIKEIEDVPIILMPGEADYRASHVLDGITNAYRYYKVAEYIYQNYVPLYKYGTDYTVWCRPERYEEYMEELSGNITSTEYAGSLLTSEDLRLANAELFEEEGMPVIAYTQTDPMIMDLQAMIDISPFIGKEMTLVIEYETDTSGMMQLFYTTEEGENYKEEKAVNVSISDKGTATFTVPVTEYTCLRLDTPEYSKVKILSFIVSGNEYISYISYGYDGPTESTNSDGSLSFSYTGINHNYNINHLPRIWAEGDKEEANDNPILLKLVNQEGMFVFDGEFISREDGNYLKITATYDGNDKNGLFEDDDEYLGGTVVFGEYQNGQFKEKYYYNLTFKEGQHDYIIRCSTDYYWYTGDVNAVKVRVDGILRDMELKLLEGD